MSTSTATDISTLSGTYTIDPAHSRIGFVARHAMVTKVRGAFNDFDGSITLDGANPANSAATVTIGQEHRHQERAAGRAPARQRLPVDGRVPADHVRLHQRGADRR